MGSQSSTPMEQDIIVKCGLARMTKHFFNEYVFIWHDPKIASFENQGYIPQIEKLCEVKTFTEWREAAEFVKAANAICHVITSGTNRELLTQEIASSPNVSNIYAKNFPQKVSCVENQIENVLTKLMRNLQKWYKKSTSLNLNLPAFAPIFTESDKTEMNHLHLYLKEFTNFKNRKQAKNDFIMLARAIHPGDGSFIKDFGNQYNDYNKKAIIKWYTKECFLYKFINNSLRVATSDSVQYCRLILKDLEQAIKEQYHEASKEFSGLLYRGAHLSTEEWSELKQNLGQEIEMHGFLSTSRKRNLALQFVQMDPLKKVLITVIVPKGPNSETQGFADIEAISQFGFEKEILFNIRSRFTVLEAHDKYAPNLPYRHLVLLYGAQGFRKHMIEDSLTEVAVPSSENISCKNCNKKPITGETLFLSLVYLQNQIYICQNCRSDFLKENNAPLLCISAPLEETKYTLNGFTTAYPKNLSIPFYGYSCHQCQAKKQKTYFYCTKCSQKYCEQCHIASDCFNQKHLVILESNPFSFWCEKMSEAELYHFNYQNGLISKDKLFSQAEVYHQSHQPQKVIEFYTAYIQRNEKAGDHFELAMAYNNIGRAYENKADFKEALVHYFKCLELSKSALTKDHPNLTTPYNNIGNLFKKQGELSKAEEYYAKALHLSNLGGYDENQSDLATTYNNVGNIHDSKAEYPQALENYHKALEIFEKIKGLSHPLVATIIYNIASAYQSQGKDQKALQFHKKSLEKRIVVHGEKHPDVAASYHNIGRVYEKQGKSKEALENYSKSLEIYKRILGENHPDLTTIWNSIGNVHYLQGEYEKAIENYSKVIKISTLETERATSYTNLANVSNSKEEYNDALKYSSEALEILKKIHGPDHEHVASALFATANIHKSLEDYEKSLEFFFKSLEIKKIIHEENHSSIAASYWNIGDTYNCFEKFPEALEYKLKSLEIRKVIW